MAILNVPSTYPTIQAAVNAAMPGDTIVVAPGTYNEQVTIPANKPNLTLLGAQAGVDARSRGATPPNPSVDSIITFNSGGIVTVLAQNFIIDGFTITDGGSGNAITSATSSPPTYNITGLQVLNNVIINNSNGVIITSLQDQNVDKMPNYLVQYNYFAGNTQSSVTAGNGIGGVNSIFSDLVVTQNYFNDPSFGRVIGFSGVIESTITSNIINNSGVISIFMSTNIDITNNANTNALDTAIQLIQSNNINILNNIISMAVGVGIDLYTGNNNVNINGNCITDSGRTGILLDSSAIPNSNVTIINNNIQRNTVGLQLDPNSYINPPLLNATSNYWNSPSGPNYISTVVPPPSSGTGDSIVDNNIFGVQSVQFESFSTVPFICPNPPVIPPMNPIILTKTSPSTNISPGDLITFTVTITVPTGTTSPVTSFTDQLPPLPSGNMYVITAQSPNNFFTLTPTTPQNLIFTNLLPTTLTEGTYSVMVMAITTLSDSGAVLTNTATLTLMDGTITSSNATASVINSTQNNHDIQMCYIFQYYRNIQRYNTNNQRCYCTLHRSHKHKHKYY
jgi:hypothetical protein